MKLFNNNNIGNALTSRLWPLALLVADDLSNFLTSYPRTCAGKRNPVVEVVENSRLQFLKYQVYMCDAILSK